MPREFDGDVSLEADVVIVGAGPGGSAAAYRLSKLGRKVVALEMGGSYVPSDFSPDGGRALKNLYQDAGMRFTHGNSFFVTMFGKGVGGGSLVNSGISFTPPDKAIRRWATEAELENFSPESLAPYVKEVERVVPIEVKDIQSLGRNNTIFRDGLEKLSYNGGVIPRNTKGCRGCGICFFGCPSGAKQSVDKNFMSLAVELGAEVYTFARVMGIELDRNKKTFKSLFAVVHDPDTGKPRARLEVKAKALVLAAGAVGTAQLLLKDNIANSSGQVGRNFHCHPSVGIIGVFEEPIAGFNSVVQGYYSDEFFDRDILLETYWGPPGVFATFIPGFGEGPTAAMKKFPYFAGAGGMIRDESAGVLNFDGLKVDIEYNVNKRDQELLTEALFRSSEVLLAAGAKTIYADSPGKKVFTSLGDLRDYFAKVKNLGTDIIREGNHGMGTCRMGGNSKNSVVNSYGKSHDVGNLWILDVSAFPSALGVNPQITIMALALRGAEALNGHIS